MLLLLLILVVKRDEGAVRAGHFSDHATRYLGGFFGDGEGVLGGVFGVPAGVGVAAGGDEEGEVEEPVGVWVLVYAICMERGCGGVSGRLT